MSPAKPIAAVFFDLHSFFMLDIVEGARGLCDIVWVMYLREYPVDATSLRMLNRVGVVLDGSGLTSAELGEELLARGVGGILTYSDHLIEPAAEVAAHAGYRFHTPEVALRLRNKFLQRTAFAQAGVVVPSYVALPLDADPAAVRELVDSATLPVVVKPLIGVSSRDASVVRSREELEELLRSRDESLVVEGYLEDAPPVAPGDPHYFPGRAAAHFLSVESVVEDGVVHNLFLTGRFPIAEPLRESGGYLPCDLPQDQERDVCAVATAAAEALGIQDGFLHVEIKLTPDGPRIIEVNGRIGGNIPSVALGSGGPDLITWSLMHALRMPLPELPTRTGVAYWAWGQPPEWASRIVSVTGMEELAQLDGVSSVTVHKTAGDAVDWHEGGLSWVWAVEGSVPDHETLWERYRQIYDTGTVIYEQ